MKKNVLMTTLLLDFAGTTFAQSVTVDAPSGYKVVIVLSSVGVSRAVNVTTAPQTVYITPAPAPTPIHRAHPCVRHVASVGERMIIEHQIDNHR